MLAAGFEDEAVEGELDELTRERLQDDERFAEVYARSRTARGYGPRRVEGELRQRGVAQSMIDDLFATGEVDWFELARAACSKKFGNGWPESFKDKARRMRFLEYRGFLPDQIQHAVGDRSNDAN